MIQLADGLSLPLSAATQTFLIVGKRGSGKTSTCVRLAEQLFAAGKPFVVLDPVDTWWGLKANRAGDGPGLGVYVFGGTHQDLPLEPASGALVADTLVEHDISAVLSIKHFSGRERTRFVSDFAERLFQKNKTPRHVILEEAHEVAPQNPYHGEEEMLGRITRLVKLGRSSGIGVSAVTQRPASLNKNITTQAEILIVHRLLGPQDIAAVKEWIKYHGESDEVLSQLSTLKTGEAFIWGPDFPEDAPIGLQRIRVLDRTTYDSSATPKDSKRREPVRLAPVDLQQLGARMAEAAERARQDDPAALRQRIAELEAQLTDRPAPTAQQAIEVLAPRLTAFAQVINSQARMLAAQVSAFNTEHLQELFRAALDGVGRVELEAMQAWGDVQVSNPHGYGKTLDVPLQEFTPFTEEVPDVHKAIDGFQETIGRLSALGALRPSDTVADRAHDFLGLTVTPRRAEREAPAEPDRTSSEPLSGPETRILIAVASLQAHYKRPPLSIAVAFLAGYRGDESGAFQTPRSRLRVRGFIDYPSHGYIGLSDEGQRRYGASCVETLTPAYVQSVVFGKLTGPEARILRPLLAAYPKAIPQDQLARMAAYSNDSSGAFQTPRSRLRTLGLIDYPSRGAAAAAHWLFLK